MELAGRVEEIERLNLVFQQICSELVYPPGSLFRITAQHFPNWGIEVNEGNRSWLERSSVESYYEEWRRGSKESNEAIEAATAKANLPHGNENLNDKLGDLAVGLLQDLSESRERIYICDVGAGAGGTTKAILDYLDIRAEADSRWIDVIRKCHFYLIEPSHERLGTARKNLETHPINRKAKADYTLVTSNHSNHFPIMGRGCIDMLVSSAVFHHMTFPTYLRQIRERLADDGVMVMGDWYTVIWKHPAFIFQMLQKLGMSDRNLERFMVQFRLSKGGIYALEKELEAYHLESNSMMVDYEVKIAEEFQRIPKESRLYFLEAHESLEDRLVKVAEAGFESDLRELKAKHGAFVRADRTIKNLFPGSDFATVIAAAKIPGHTPSKDPAEIRKRIREAILRA